jgi:hypothetical protein
LQQLLPQLLQQLEGAAQVASQQPLPALPQHEAGAAQVASQHEGLQQRERLSKPQPLLQQPEDWQHELGAAQVASQQPLPLPQHPGAAEQQLGAASQHLVSQQLLVQPQPLAPSMRSRRSKLNPWVQVAIASTNDPRIMFHFIDRRLLFHETRMAQSRL